VSGRAKQNKDIPWRKTDSQVVFRLLYWHKPSSAPSKSWRKVQHYQIVT